MTLLGRAPRERPTPRRRRTPILVLAVLVAALAQAAAAQAETCSYSADTREVFATITPGGEATLRVEDGAIAFGAVATPCGAATTTNTETIVIYGAAGSSERLILDERGGVFQPGFTSEAPQFSEIEIDTVLGDGTDTVVVYATEGPDHIAPGQNGLALTADGDVDVTFSPGIFPMEIYALGGDDYINGRGVRSGPALPRPADDRRRRGQREPDPRQLGPRRPLRRSGQRQHPGPGVRRHYRRRPRRRHDRSRRRRRPGHGRDRRRLVRG